MELLSRAFSEFAWMKIVFCQPTVIKMLSGFIIGCLHGLTMTASSNAFGGRVQSNKWQQPCVIHGTVTSDVIHSTMNIGSDEDAQRLIRTFGASHTQLMAVANWKWSCSDPWPMALPYLCCESRRFGGQFSMYLSSGKFKRRTFWLPFVSPCMLLTDVSY